MIITVLVVVVVVVVVLPIKNPCIWIHSSSIDKGTMHVYDSHKTCNDDSDDDGSGNDDDIDVVPGVGCFISCNPFNAAPVSTIRVS